MAGGPLGAAVVVSAPSGSWGQPERSCHKQPTEMQQPLGSASASSEPSGAKVQDHREPPGPPLRNSGGDVTDGHPKTDQMGLKAGPPPAGKPGSACEVPLWRSPPNPPSSCLLPSCFPGGHLPGCLGNMRSGHDKHVATGLSQPSVSQGCRGGRGWGELSSCGRASGAPEGSPGTPKPHRHGPGDAA